jgi:hypothetical protein
LAGSLTAQECKDFFPFFFLLFEKALPKGVVVVVVIARWGLRRDLNPPQAVSAGSGEIDHSRLY